MAVGQQVYTLHSSAQHGKRVFDCSSIAQGRLQPFTVAIRVYDRNRVTLGSRAVSSQLLREHWPNRLGRLSDVYDKRPDAVVYALT